MSDGSRWSTVVWTQKWKREAWVWGVSEVGEEEGGEGVEVIEFVGEVGGSSKGRAADGLADNAEAGGVFSSGGKGGEGSSQVGSIRGGKGGKRGGASGGGEEFGFGEVEGDAMGAAKGGKIVKEEREVGEGEGSGDVVNVGQGSGKGAKVVITGGR